MLTITVSYIYNMLFSSIDKQCYQLLNITHPREWGFPIIAGWRVGFPRMLCLGEKAGIVLSLLKNNLDLPHIVWVNTRPDKLNLQDGETHLYPVNPVH